MFTINALQISCSQLRRLTYHVHNQGVNVHMIDLYLQANIIHVAQADSGYG
jgi:hypothetical protein